MGINEGDHAAEWWHELSETEQIIAVLEAREAGLINDLPTYVAAKPWKYIDEAYRAHLQGALPVSTTTR